MDGKRKFTPETIDELKANEVFVFGSNRNGNHYGGAAKVAYEKFGAEWKSIPSNVIIPEEFV